jgi:hypothetical protein
MRWNHGWYLPHVDLQATRSPGHSDQTAWELSVQPCGIGRLAQIQAGKHGLRLFKLCWDAKQLAATTCG